jgi:endoglucanase
MLPTYAASSSPVALRGFIMPDSPRIIVSVHAYTPYRFALSSGPENTWDAHNPDDTQDIDSLFTHLDDIFLQKNIPVILGECGARYKGNMSAQARWAKYYTDKARAHHVPCIWWDNGSFAGTGELFGLMDRARLTWAYPDIVQAFLGK